jgi:phage terminase large subunit
MSRDEITVEISRKVFNPAYLPYLDDGTETQIFYGGSSSGKSYFLAERVVYDLLGGRRNYLICRKVGKYVMKSVWIEVENVIAAWGLDDLFEKNKTDRTITCTENGKQAIFTGLDEPQKLKSIRAKSGAITDLWIEEATEAEPNDIKELEKRQRGGDEGTPKRLVLSFNPIMQSHWIYTRYFGAIGWADRQKEHRDGGLSILKTTYQDNRFLTRQDVDRLENETDKYYHDVYTLGNWGVLGDVIFTNWTVEDLSDRRDQMTNHRNGLDFGFSADPAGMPVTHYDKKKKTIYIYDELYEHGLTNDLLAGEIKRLIGRWTKDANGQTVCTGTEYVICDSAEPKSIAELQGYKVNALAAKKGKDSVNFGIQWLQQQNIVVDKKCVKTQMELQQYQWKKDKDGRSIKVPSDKNNHILDGLRYAYENDMVTGDVILFGA